VYGDCVDDSADALAHVERGGIDYESSTIPRPIVTVEHFLPGRQDMTGDVGGARFDTTPMLVSIRADDFDVEEASAGIDRDALPRVPGERPGIDGVGDHRASETEIVAGYRMRNQIPFLLDTNTGIAQRLFDGVDPKVDPLNRPRKFPGNRGFPST